MTQQTKDYLTALIPAILVVFFLFLFGQVYLGLN